MTTQAYRCTDCLTDQDGRLDRSHAVASGTCETPGLRNAPFSSKQSTYAIASGMVKSPCPTECRQKMGKPRRRAGVGRKGLSNMWVPTCNCASKYVTQGTGLCREQMTNPDCSSSSSIPVRRSRRFSPQFAALTSSSSR
jgi:hypothetical protein